MLFLNGLENLNVVYAGGFDDIIVVSKKINKVLTLQEIKSNSFYSHSSQFYLNKNYEIFQKLTNSSLKGFELLKSNYLHSTFLNSKAISLEYLQINKFNSLIKEHINNLELINQRELFLNNSLMVTSDHIDFLISKDQSLRAKLEELLGKDFCNTYLKRGVLNHYFLLNYDERDNLIKVYIFTSQPNIKGCKNFGDCTLIAQFRFDSNKKPQYMRNTPVALNWKGDTTSAFLLLKELFFTINYNNITLEDCILKNLNLSKLGIKNLDDMTKNNIADLIIEHGLIYIRDMSGVCYKIDNGKVELLDCSCTSLKNNNNKFKWKG